jgi:CHAD domain-containing protein
VTGPASGTLGARAIALVGERYAHLLHHESGAIRGHDAEAVHQVRVWSRRLTAALEAFAPALQLPAAVSPRYLRRLTRRLGKVRNLDVREAVFAGELGPELGPGGQDLIDRTVARIRARRRHAQRALRRTLTRRRHRDFELAMARWIESPRLTRFGSMPLNLFVPDLVGESLGKLMLHPGWSVAANSSNTGDRTELHTLRKRMREMRYRAEGLADCYGNTLDAWIAELARLQDTLGVLHDTQRVLGAIPRGHGPRRSLEQLRAAAGQRLSVAEREWEHHREAYLDPAYRDRLRRMLLNPAQLTPTP